METWLIDKFWGGNSEGTKTGIKNSFYLSQGLDYKTDPDVLTGNKKLVKNSGATVDGLVKWMVKAGTDIYMYADNGDVYKRTSGGTWSTSTTLANGAGQGLEVFDDYLFAIDNDGIHKYGPLSNSPSWQTDFLVSAANEIDINTLTSGNTYQLPTSITENATNREDFTPTVNNITGVAVKVAVKGAGDWTLTVHDSGDAVVAAKTITNANMPSSGWVRFEFTGVHTITVSGSYHFHLTVSSGTTSTVVTTTASDLNTSSHATLREYLTEDVDQEESAFTTVSETDIYTLPTSISEAATARQSFVPERSNLSAVSVAVYEKGSGDWTLTVHDDRDRVVATKTITNANMKQGKGYVKFEFSSAVSVVPDATYHFHLTVTSGTSTVLVTTASDLETVGYRTHYQILSTDTQWHPALYFPAAQKLCIGNGNFLAVYDNVLYREPGARTGSERLQFAKEEKVRCLALYTDYLAIGVWKGTSVSDDGESRIYFWNGTSRTYSNFKDIPGEVNAMITGNDGLLYVWHGGYGHLSIFDGSLTLVKTIPLVGENKTIEIYPGAVSNWRGVPHFGISDGTSTTVQRGVWAYGTVNKNFPRSLNLEYPISTGTTTGTGVQIGALLGVGPDQIFVSWKDSSSYGVDLIDTANDQASVYVETLYFDANTPHLPKNATAIKVTHYPLASGQSITVEYKADNTTGGWTQALVSNTAGETTETAALKVGDTGEWKELKLKITLASDGADLPKFLSGAVFFEINKQQQE